MIGQYDWDFDTALAVCQAESQGRAEAFNPSNYDGSNDKGLFQINSVHVGRFIGDEERFNPTANVTAAYKIYLGSGWSAWSAYNNETYKKYL
ncbi:transglycosylase SLT domain-containing protein [Pseudarthrobacter sp902506025]|uniref:transglycosylase SLT domain-containing protein n=1 Tax=Pseudarthrobacter sp. 902506025 TaxID=3155291 RepID=UPI00344BAD46